MKEPKVIETPHGTITLLPISEEDMEKMKTILLNDPDLDLDLMRPYEGELCGGGTSR